PEAQLDRFMFMLWLDYPSFEEEIDILKATTTGTNIKVKSILSKEEIILMQDLIRKIPVTDNVYEYAVHLVEKTRVSTPKAHPIAQKYLSWGAGPRASQYLIIGAKCHAALRGKYSPDIEDIKAVAVSVLRHRIVQNYSSQAEGYTAEKIIIDLINS
ncbi:MAG: MoxR family ATPase, partial [Bacteroidales bacterium]